MAEPVAAEIAVVPLKDTIMDEPAKLMPGTWNEAVPVVSWPGERERTVPTEETTRSSVNAASVKTPCVILTSAVLKTVEFVTTTDKSVPKAAVLENVMEPMVAEAPAVTSVAKAGVEVLSTVRAVAALTEAEIALLLVMTAAAVMFSKVMALVELRIRPLNVTDVPAVARALTLV